MNTSAAQTAGALGGPGAVGALPGPIEQLLARVRSAVRTRRAQRYARRGAFWGGVAASAVLIAKGAFGDDLFAIGLAAALALACIIAASILGATRRIPPLVVAQAADRAYRLQDRVSTTLEQSDKTTPFWSALMADTLERVQALQGEGKSQARPSLPERAPSLDMRLAPLALLVAVFFAVAPPLPGTQSWLDNAASGREGRPQASLLERLKQMASELLQSKPLDMPEVAKQAADPAQAPPKNAQEFHEKDLSKPRNDFTSFVNKGDERLKLLEKSDKLPDLQSDFATSKARMLMKQTQELQSGRGPNRISATKLGEILKEMERMGRRGNTEWADDVAEGQQALESGNTEGALSSAQNALDKMRKAEDAERAKRALSGGKDNRPADQADDGRGDAGKTGDFGGRGYSQGGGASKNGAPTPRLRSTPYDTGIEGQRRARAPTTETGATARPGGGDQQLQYLGEFGEYRRLMEDAISREQVPRDYHQQIREYFKSLQQQ